MQLGWRVAAVHVYTSADDVVQARVQRGQVGAWVTGHGQGVQGAVPSPPRRRPERDVDAHGEQQKQQEARHGHAPPRAGRATGLVSLGFRVTRRRFEGYKGALGTWQQVVVAFLQR
jgi:hypothetical protein